jgi:DNA-binding GntR family transcriptional regulator
MSRITSHEIAYNKIKKSIMFGDYRSGEHLSETGIAKEIGVSRTPVRDALIRLERDGFVTRKPYKGMIVRKFNREEAREAYEVRGALEGLAAYLAAENITDEQKEELETILEHSRIALNSHDFKNLTIYNNSFHEKIIEISNNDMLQKLLNNLRGFISISRLYVWAIPDRPAKTLEEHQIILNSIKSGNATLAGQKAAEHVNNSWKAAKMRLDQQQIGE